MMICCRCQSKLNPRDALGGTYGGLVCINHRVCPDCWWNIDNISQNKGKRKIEDNHTKNIAIVDHPRKDAKIKCYGCFYKLTNYNLVKDINFIGLGTLNEPIIFN